MNLSSFSNTNLFTASIEFFSQLGIKFKSPTAQPLKPDEVLGEYFNQRIPFTQIDEIFFLGLIDDNIFRDQVNTLSVQDETHKQVLEKVHDKYPGIMVFAVSLSDGKLTRTELSEITRAFNKASKRMPVVVLYKYSIDKESYITFTITERTEYKQEWRQGEKIGKVTLLKDIKILQPHTGHIKILNDLKTKPDVNTFELLYKQWKEVFDIQLLNKNFYKELANWFYWAMDNVEFPDDIEKNKDIRNATNLIRLLTRIIFIWFIKEKGLVPDILFSKRNLGNIVKDFYEENKSTYYNAILQNLFFATLNQKMGERKFAIEGSFEDHKKEYGVKNLFRYADQFLINEKDALKLFENIPFLNGGLFDCLDKYDDNGKMQYVDGFSRNAKKRSNIPNVLFFSDEDEVDLNKIYGTKNKRFKVKGLINILDSYKFTVTENTPLKKKLHLTQSY
jgi:hypothetical protein